MANYSIRSLVLALLAFCAAIVPARAGIIVNIGELALDLGPDARTTRQLEIANTGDKPAEISVFASDYTQDETGAVEAVEAKDPHAPDSATRWVNINPERFVLQKGEKKVVTLSIATPKGPLALPEYRTMIFTQTSDTTKSQESALGRELQVHVIGRIGTKLYVRNPQVPAKVDCDVVKMEETMHDGRRALSVRVHNNGSVHLRSDTSTVAFRDDSGVVVETLPLPAFSALPDQFRTIFFNLPEPGKSKLQKDKRYNALAVVDYGGGDLVAGELPVQY